MMTSKLCVAASILASVASYEAKADPQPDPKSIDILGFRLGMPADQVADVARKNIENAIISPRAGSLSMGTYTSPEMTFSEEISHPQDYSRGATADELETVKLTFGQQPGAGILAIDRSHPYSQEKAPTIKALIASIEEKYGKPTNIEEEPGPFGHYLLVYSYNASIPYDKEIQIGRTIVSCSQNMPGGSQTGLVNNLTMGNVTSEVSEIVSKCGTQLTFKIQPLHENPDLAGLMYGRIADLKGLRESNFYLLDLLNKGAQGSAEAEKEKAAANKTKL